jgi:GT2 family glycosyltransferase
MARPDLAQVFGGPPSGERETCLGFAAFFTLEHPNYAVAGWRLEYENDAGVELESRIVNVERDAAAIRQLLFDVAAKCDVPKKSTLASVLRPAFEGLQRRSDSQPKVRFVDTLGEPPRDPRVSIVVPLYGRIDLVEHQLAQFADDPEIRAADLIYVLDSPDHAAMLRPLARELSKLYRVPFRLVSLEKNVGYSGANNIGVAHARAELILLLNSDVIPDRPGWLSKMADFYQSRAKIGALGAKLIYEDGSLQHAGIYFARSEDGVEWANSHYFKGLSHELPAANRTRRVPAVTGACLMISHALYKQVGGFHSGYVQGDFEDSDLCLRLLKTGLENWYLPAVTLYHLESQSYPTPLRQAVGTYNRWLHTEIWNTEITATMRRFSELAEAGESP